MGPVLGIGLQRVLGGRLTRIVARGFDQPVERAGPRNMSGQGEGVVLPRNARVPFLGIDRIWWL